MNSISPLSTASKSIAYSSATDFAGSLGGRKFEWISKEKYQAISQVPIPSFKTLIAVVVLVSSLIILYHLIRSRERSNSSDLTLYQPPAATRDELECHQLSDKIKNKQNDARFLSQFIETHDTLHSCFTKLLKKQSHHIARPAISIPNVDPSDPQGQILLLKQTNLHWESRLLEMCRFITNHKELWDCFFNEAKSASANDLETLKRLVPLLKTKIEAGG
jgi:hypothetical protein